MIRRPAGNLPFDVTSFVGRRGETRDARLTLSRARLVTLSGLGGAGKSRLALHVAREEERQFRDGVWLLELDRLHDAALLPHTIMSTLGIRGESAHSAADVLAEELSDKQMLLVMDNCEHLVDACAVLVSRLLSAAPDLRILATSRQPLAVHGEVVLPVPPLSLPDPGTLSRTSGSTRGVADYEALMLLEERASAVVPGFTLHPEDWESAAELCRRLDGNPLAIELAAARLRVLRIEEILERLDSRFRLLTATSRVAPSRRQSMYAVIDGSFELCSESERLLWTRASVFAGGFDVEGAQAVCGGGDLRHEGVLDSVIALVDRSILVREDQAGISRFRMLETIRQYGQERLADSGEETVVRRRHRDHYLTLVERAESEWSGPRQPEWLARLRSEWPNLWGALDFCLSETGESHCGVRMAGLLWPLWLAAGYLGEGRHWLDRALTQPSGTAPDQARAICVNVFVTALQGSAAQARSLMSQCHEILAGSPDHMMLALSARAAGTIEMLVGDFGAAVPWFERGVRHLEEADAFHSLPVVCYADLGVVHGLSDAVGRGIASCEEGRKLCEARGEQWALSWILFVLSFLRLVRDDADDVSSDLREMLRIKESFGDVLGVLQAAELLAWVAAAHHDPRFAARILGANETLWRPVGAYLLAFGPYLVRHERCVARARAALGDDAFDTEFRTGGEMDLTELASFALGETPAQHRTSPVVRRSKSPLTRRQQEVAALVADGLSNREIAERLVVSQRTAETHVQNVLSKLGFRSRAQVARWVVDQQGARETRG